MSNKKLVCFYTEGATDEVFYNNLLNHFRTLSSSNKFSIDYVKKYNIKGIGKFESKLIRKFRSEIVPYKKKEGCELIVFLCYDKDTIFRQLECQCNIGNSFEVVQRVLGIVLTRILVVYSTCEGT